MKVIIVYTDGSCNAKTRFGGFGSFLQFQNGEKSTEIKINGGYSNTTISRMELLAVIKSLQTIAIKDRYKILVISDSALVVNSINKGWVFRWRSEGFIDRKNGDLWKLFLEEYYKFTPGILSFIHTRGHDKGLECYRKGNNIADELADYKQFNTYTEDEEKKV